MVDDRNSVISNAIPLKVMNSRYSYYIVIIVIISFLTRESGKRKRLKKVTTFSMNTRISYTAQLKLRLEYVVMFSTISSNLVVFCMISTFVYIQLVYLIQLIIFILIYKINLVVI